MLPKNYSLGSIQRIFHIKLNIYYHHVIIFVLSIILVRIKTLFDWGFLLEKFFEIDFIVFLRFSIFYFMEACQT